MKLTTKGRYAVSALLDLAEQGDDAIVCLSDISQRQSISLSYLEQLFSKLKKQGIVVSRRGTAGGYQFATPADQVSVFDVLSAVEGRIEATQCDGSGGCRGGAYCNAHGLWQGLSVQIEGYLSGIMLTNLLPGSTQAASLSSHLKDTTIIGTL